MLTGLRIHDVFQNRLNCRDFKAIVVDVLEKTMTLKDESGIIYSIFTHTKDNYPHGIVIKEATLNTFGFHPGDQVSMIFGSLKIKNQLLSLEKVEPYEIPLTLIKCGAM